MSPLLELFWQQGALVAALVIILYTGHKGFWYWSPGVRALTAELVREKNDWRTLAVMLLREKGVNLPEGFEIGQPFTLPGEENFKSR